MKCILCLRDVTPETEDLVWLDGADNKLKGEHSSVFCSPAHFHGWLERHGITHKFDVEAMGMVAKPRAL